VSFTAQRKTAVGLAAATSANGTARNGATFNTNQLGGAGLIVECISAITTSSVIATFNPQVSWDGTNWYDWKEPQQPAQVATAAGTGSEVITRRALGIDKCVIGAPYFRCQATLSGATTAAADQTTVNYKFASGVGV
jgi:hypothetical protein